MVSGQGMNGMISRTLLYQADRKMLFILTVIICIISSFLAKGNTISEKPEFEYSMTIEAENMILRLYINGAPIVFHGRLELT